MILVTTASILLINLVHQFKEIEPQPQGVVHIEVQNEAGDYLIDQEAVLEPLSIVKYRNIVRQAYDYSCGSAALTTVLQHYLGRNFQERQVMEGLLHYGENERIVERRGFSMLDMKRLVTALGFPAGGFKAEIQDLIELDHPAIVPIQYSGFKHFVVVKTIKDGRVFIADPSKGNLTFTLSRFEEAWDQNVLFVIFPGDTKPIDGLELKEEDLRFIDDQTLSLQAFQVIPDYYDMRQFRLQNEMERQRNNPEDSRFRVNNTTKRLHYRRN
ncbi:MAG: peptidase C39 [Oleiphilus sp.]|nr:MAG: peptidase C39 [Oleiphilus sp.]